MAKKAAQAAVEDDQASTVDDAPESILSYAEDINDAEAPEPLPEGDYPATIEKVERKTSTNTGNDYISVTFSISTDDYPADYDVNNAPEGKKISYNRLSPDDNIAARHRMKKFISAIGAEGGRDINLNDWVGLSAKLTLQHREYEGEQREDIKAVKEA